MRIGDILDRGAAVMPRAVAVSAGGRSVTFAELHDRVARLRAALEGQTEPGDRVAILARNCPEFVEALYGVPMAGRVLVLLNYRLHPNEWRRTLEDCGTRLLLIERHFLEQAKPILSAVEHVVEWGEGAAGSGHDYEERLARGERVGPSTTPAEADAAVIIYTSGTTGRPKGAVISHRNLAVAALVSAFEWGVETDERFVMSFPMCHASGFQTFVYHLRGAEMVLTPAFDPAELLDLVEQRRPTRVALAPTMASFVLSQPGFDRRDLSSVRSLSYGGMPMPLDLVGPLVERFGSLRTGFGQSESTLTVTSLTPEHHRRALAGETHLLASCGLPSPYCTVAILDPADQPVSEGEVGELCIRSDMVMKGYWGEPEATAQALAGGWLHTGDLARLDGEGFVYLVDRKKDMLISGGQNIYPREIELVIATLPSVAEVAVTGVSDPIWGERVVAFVVPRPSSTVTEQDVIAVCRENLAGYKQPRIVRFVDELPRNALGKVVKATLRESLADPLAPNDNEAD